MIEHKLDVPHAVFGLLRSPGSSVRFDPLPLPKAMGRDEHAGQTPPRGSSVVRFSKSVPPTVRHLRPLADQSRPQANLFRAPRDAQTLASTASSPANVTIALAPLIEAGREG
jgi:hypothetical protein